MKAELNKKGVKMINKDYYFVFDYDNTLAEKGGKIDSSLSNILLNIILKGDKVGIITSRSMFWMKKNGINFLDMIISNKENLSPEDIKEITKNLIIYSGRGNEKFYPNSVNDKLILSEDINYNKFMTMEEIFEIQEIIKKVLPKETISRETYTKQFPSYNSEGVIRVIMRIEDINLELRKKIILRIRSNLRKTKDKRFSSIFIEIDGNYLSFSFKDKSFAIKDILKDNPRKIIYYYGDSPMGNDKPIFDIANGKLKGKLSFISVENPVHTLSLIKSHFKDLSGEFCEMQNILNVLLNKKLKENISERLESYWKYMGLPSQWIPSILNILSQYISNEDLAVKKVRNKFPQITQKESLEYSKKLNEFRVKKVKNLARRINKYIQGTVIADIGGRADDFVEQIISLNKSVKRAYVTDIGTFSERSKNSKINFFVQPSLTKMPFSKESINTVILSLILHHLDNQDQKDLVKNLFSSLKKGGRIILIEDSYPEIDHIKDFNKNTNNFLKFSSAEKKKILSFYDWFGNRLMRNRDNIALTFNYRTIEEWREFFEKIGLKVVASEFIRENFSNPDLFPPKAIIIFQKRRKNRDET